MCFVILYKDTYQVDALRELKMGTFPVHLWPQEGYQGMWLLKWKTCQLLLIWTPNSNINIRRVVVLSLLMVRQSYSIYIQVKQFILCRWNIRLHFSGNEGDTHGNNKCVILVDTINVLLNVGDYERMFVCFFCVARMYIDIYYSNYFVPQTLLGNIQGVICVFPI